jgi:regulatory protein
MREDKMKEAKIKAGSYCAYQERTQQEVRDKLYSLGLFRDEVEEVLTDLIIEKFVDEERYARAFASGKFRIKKWGKMKISYALKQKKLSSYCIDRALEEISKDEYEEQIIQLIEKKYDQLSGDEFMVKNKIVNYLVGKGYEHDLIWPLLNNYLQGRR